MTMALHVARHVVGCLAVLCNANLAPDQGCHLDSGDDEFLGSDGGRI